MFGRVLPRKAVAGAQAAVHAGGVGLIHILLEGPAHPHPIAGGLQDQGVRPDVLIDFCIDVVPVLNGGESHNVALTLEVEGALSNRDRFSWLSEKSKG